MYAFLINQCGAWNGRTSAGHGSPDLEFGMRRAIYG